MGPKSFPRGVDGLKKNSLERNPKGEDKVRSERRFQGSGRCERKGLRDGRGANMMFLEFDGS